MPHASPRGPFASPRGDGHRQRILLRSPARRCLPFAALVLAAPGLHALQGGSPQVLARFETSVPNATEFVLRGTLPIPPGVYTDEVHGTPTLEQQFPFCIRDHDGSLVVPQVEVVSRYPNSADGAAVVELVARVGRQASLPLGTDVVYDVVSSAGQDLAGLLPAGWDSDPLGALKPQASVGQLFTSGIPPHVRARDAYGNLYAASLLPGLPLTFGAPGLTEFTRMGHAALQVRTYATMQGDPTLPSSGPLHSHLFGVHSYLGAYRDEGFVSFDLRVHNGFSGKKATNAMDDAIGRVYFSDLEVVLPEQYALVPLVLDQALGTPKPAGFGMKSWPIAKDPSDGTLHVIDQGFQLHRRFVIVDAGSAEAGVDFAVRHGQAFCRPGTAPDGSELWSWWNTQTPNYFPQRHALPEFPSLGKDAVRAQIEASWMYIATKLASGQSGAPPLTSPALGWAHPYGQAYGGVTGGMGIHLYEGVETAWAAARNGYRYYETLHRMQMDRTRNVVYDADGTPTTLQEWLQVGPGGPYFPGYLYLTTIPSSDPFGWKSAPTFQSSYAASAGLAPAYENDLLLYESYDMQHLIRATRAAKTLAWLGNDPLAKDDLFMQAALVEMSYNMAANDQWGSLMPTGMKADDEFVTQNPGIGFEFSRAEGWAVDTMAAAFSLAPPSWREPRRQWFDDLVDIVDAGQAVCTGFLTAELSDKILDGKYRSRQAYSHAIVENGMYGVWRSAFAGTGSVRESILEDVLRKALYAMIDPNYWDPIKQAPFQQAAVGPLDLAQPLYCAALPSDGFTPDDWDTYQCWSSFAYGFELTLDPVFLLYASWMIGNNDLGAALDAAGTSNVQNQAALIALSQALGL